jgi:hypothetical protein
MLLMYVGKTSLSRISLFYVSSLFSFRDKKMDQKKKTTFKYKTRSSGGTKARLITVAGTHSFPKETRREGKHVRLQNDCGHTAVFGAF